jgi:hypothetical protein
MLAFLGRESCRRTALVAPRLVPALRAVSRTPGLDPSLGVLHTDKRYRGSLAADLMEVGRPVAEEVVIELLDGRELRRGEVYETHEGACRLGASLAHELAHHGAALRRALVPQADRMARTLLGGCVDGGSAVPARRRNRQTAGKGMNRAGVPRS